MATVSMVALAMTLMSVWRSQNDAVPGVNVKIKMAPSRVCVKKALFSISE